MPRLWIWAGLLLAAQISALELDRWSQDSLGQTEAKALEVTTRQHTVRHKVRRKAKRMEVRAAGSVHQGAGATESLEQVKGGEHAQHSHDERNQEAQDEKSKKGNHMGSVIKKGMGKSNEKVIKKHREQNATSIAEHVETEAELRARLEARYNRVMFAKSMVVATQCEDPYKDALLIAPDEVVNTRKGLLASLGFCTEQVAPVPTKEACVKDGVAGDAFHESMHETGVFLAHQDAWKKIVELGRKAMVLEADFSVADTPEAVAKLKARIMKAFSKDEGYTSLGTCGRGCTTAYYMDPVAAQKLLTKTTPLCASERDGVDSYLSAECSSGTMKCSWGEKQQQGFDKGSAITLLGAQLKASKKELEVAKKEAAAAKIKMKEAEKQAEQAVQAAAHAQHEASTAKHAAAHAAGEADTAQAAAAQAEQGRQHAASELLLLRGRVLRVGATVLTVCTALLLLRTWCQPKSREPYSQARLF